MAGMLFSKVSCLEKLPAKTIFFWCDFVERDSAEVNNEEELDLTMRSFASSINVKNLWKYKGEEGPVANDAR